MLSLGATKNGALGADAVVFFDPAMARDFERRRKRAGHLMSKLRFVSAQLIAYFKNGLWLDNARHANAMAMRMAQGLKTVARREAAAPRAMPTKCSWLLPEETGRQPGKSRDLIFTAGRCIGRIRCDDSLGDLLCDVERRGR